MWLLLGYKSGNDQAWPVPWARVSRVARVLTDLKHQIIPGHNHDNASQCIHVRFLV